MHLWVGVAAMWSHFGALGSLDVHDGHCGGWGAGAASGLVPSTCWVELPWRGLHGLGDALLAHGVVLAVGGVDA